jgi:hypothetical protein
VANSRAMTSTTTAIRAALAGALLATAGGLLAPNNLLAFYLTVLAAAVLLFAAFLSYLDAAETLNARTALILACNGLAGVLVMADAAIRFPAVLDPQPPGGAGALALFALVVVLAGQSAQLLRRDSRLLRDRLAPVRELLSR